MLNSSFISHPSNLPGFNNPLGSNFNFAFTWSESITPKPPPSTVNTCGLKIIEFETVALAFNYLLQLEKWPKCNPVITGSIFLVAEFIKFAKNQKS